MVTRLFDVPVSTVLQGVACTWCGARVAEGCFDVRHGRDEPTEPHAQRWRDYWNATHEAPERVNVYVDPRRRL